MKRTMSSQSGIHIFIPVDLVLLDNKSHVTKEDEDDDYVSGDIAKNRLVYILYIYAYIYIEHSHHMSSMSNINKMIQFMKKDISFLKLYTSI